MVACKALLAEQFESVTGSNQLWHSIPAQHGRFVQQRLRYAVLVYCHGYNRAEILDSFDLFYFELYKQLQNTVTCILSRCAYASGFC